MDAPIPHTQHFQLPLPIKSLGHVNVYYFDGSEPGLVDSGMLYRKSILELSRGLGRRLCMLERVVLTHFHVDHSTLSTIISRISGAEVAIGEHDYEVIDGSVEEFVGSALDLFVESGMPVEEAKRIKESHPAIRLLDAYGSLRDVSWRLLREGDRIKLGDTELKVYWFPGHTPGHIALVHEESKTAYTGDLILEAITPHVTLHSWDSNPLRDYIESLWRIASLGLRKAFPGHRSPLERPEQRALKIIRHHGERLSNILQLLSRHGGMSGYDVARRVKWRVRYSSWNEYPAAEKFFAMGEALAHLRYLEVEGAVERYYSNGVAMWRLSE